MITEPVLPAGLTKETFAQAIEEYKGVVGDENVFVDLEQLAPYFKTLQPEDDKLHQASGVISARSVEEIQGVLVICNKYKIPVWTISTGRNFGYGSAAPATPGQMILDLRRMNRILHVDKELCTVLLEPGVTFQQLNDYLVENDIPLWVSHPAPGPIVSPVGNALDRGVGYNRQGQNVESICGMEVVLANGDVIRTGMGGLKGTDSWQAYKWGFGPNTEGLFHQSNFGVVTKMGLYLQPKPKAYKTFLVAVESDENFVKAANIYRQLRLQMVVENGTIGASPLFAPSMVVPRAAMYDGPGAIPGSELEKIAKRFGVPPYTVFCTLYGTDEQIAVDYKIVEEAFAGVGFVMTAENNVPPGHPLWHWENMTTSRFDLHEFGMYNFRGGGGSTWISPVVPAIGEVMLKSVQLNRDIFTSHGFDYLGGFVFGTRFAEHVMALEFDKTDPEQMKAAYACYEDILLKNAEVGHAPYRVNAAFMKKTADVYGPENAKLNARLKAMIDPNNILAPGKSGVG